MNYRILLAYLFFISTVFSVKAQCPTIISGTVANSTTSASGICTFDLFIEVKVEGAVNPNAANNSVYVTVSVGEEAPPIRQQCIGGVKGTLTTKVIPSLQVPSCTDIADLVVEYTQHAGNSGCAGGNPNNNNGCSEENPLEAPLNTNLPVDLTSFQATQERFHQVQLEWVTASEEQNAVFAVERSTDGRSFEELAKVDGNGTTNVEHYYTYMDKFPENGVNYYRLKQIDFDGTFSYSDVINIDIEKNTTKPLVIANSLAEDEITLVFNELPNSNATVEIFNATGIQFYQQKVLPETNNLSINVSDFEPGVYFVRVPIGKEYQVERFMKVAK